MESTESSDYSLNWKKNQEGQLYQQNYLGKAFEKAPHEREPKRKRKRSVGRGNTGPEHKDFSKKLPWDGSNMLNMRGHLVKAPLAGGLEWEPGCNGLAD